MIVWSALKRLFEARPVAFGILICGVVFLAEVASLFVLHGESVAALKDNIRHSLTRIARVASSVVDADLHASFNDPAQEKSPEYERAIAPLRHLQESDEDIAFVYTCVLKDGKVYFILDPTEEGDSDEDGVDDKSHIMDEYPEAAPQLIAALEKGVSTADPEPVSDRWGTFISGYAPLRDSKGVLIGIVGIDLTADKYVERLALIQSALMLGILVAGLLALLTGIVAAMVKRTALREKAEANQRDEENKREISNALARLEMAYSVVDFARQRFVQLFEGLPVPCLTFDSEYRVFEFNQQAAAAFGLSASRSLERPIYEVFGGESFANSERKALSGVLKGKSFSDREWSFKRRTYILSGHPLTSPEGEITGGILAAVEVTRQKAAEDRVKVQLRELDQAHRALSQANQDLIGANRKLEALATIDPLTGLANLRAFYARLQELIDGAYRGETFSLIMTDIDHFKAFNDKRGHLAGDRVLIDVGNVLQQCLRSPDMLARYGGEEFCALLRGVSLETAKRIADRMRETVESMGSECGAVTASFGVCEWSPELSTPESLVNSADEALYRAKQEGRNRVVLASRGPKRAA